MLIGTEIIYSWLFLTYWRITKSEFVLSWLTFLSVIGLCAILPVQVCPQRLRPLLVMLHHCVTAMCSLHMRWPGAL